MRLRVLFVAGLALGLLLSASAVGAGTASGAATPAARFLTGPNSGKPLDIALAYLKAHKQQLGLTASDLGDVAVSDQYTDALTGTTHIYLQQRYKGIGVYNGITDVNVAKDGSVINVGNRFVSNLAAAVNSASPGREAKQGVKDAAKALGLDLKQEPKAVKTPGGPAQATVFDNAGISLQPIPARLVYVPTSSGVRLAWNTTVYETDAQHWWNTNTDTATGDLLSKADYVDNESYNVFAPPEESPLDGGRSLVANPFDTLASPFGWHDTDGVAGAESTLTIGNNVHAATDLNHDNVPDAGSEPDGGAGLLFDFPLDLSTQEPADYRPAAVTNLFFWNNYLHDVSYRYGFTEAAGNFQANNYGRGGADGDSVNADAQDGNGLNNANFGTPPDGLSPRMQMYVWTPSIAFVTVNAPASIAGTYTAGAAQFGPSLTTAGLTGDVVAALDPEDGAGPTKFDACSALTNDAAVAGNIALVDRGTCNFTVKVKNAQVAGAIAVIVADNQPGPVVGMGGTDGSITIPSVRITKDDGDTLRTALASDTVNATLARPHNRDSDLDNGVIAHEYTHGISNRLTGGPSNVSCLNNAEEEGEGWSDFMALVLTAKAGQTGTTLRPIGAYVNFGPGIRDFPYTTDMSANPQTYDSVKQFPEVHFSGAVWAEMLWEMYWNLVNQYGFDPNIVDSYTHGGNNLALQLVMDGMKLQPCNPGFVDSRNAILLADQNLTGGANQCLIWRAFAKRGLGQSANQGSSDSLLDGTQNFTVPSSACGPVATTDPTSLASTLVRGQSETKTLKVKNTGLVGADDLHWTVSEAASDCSSPSDLTWVSETPASGTTAQGSSTSVSVSFNSTGLTPGQTYSGLLCLSSDDPAKPTVSIPISLLVRYAFTGFFGGIKDPSVLNPANAGSTVTLTFSLSGNWGLNVFASGYPKSQQINCTTKATIGSADSTSTPPGNSLSYDSTLDRYTYPWKTVKSYAGTCRQFILQLKDGSAPHIVYFKFS